MEKNFTTKTANLTAEEFSALGILNSDFDRILDYGISPEKVAAELQIFKKGIAKVNLDRPATVGDGILKLSREEFAALELFFDENKSHYDLEKFVPASGAASRMFQFLLAFLNEYNADNDSINGFINRNKASDLTAFLAGKQNFPFYRELKLALREHYSQNELRENDSLNYNFIKLLLDKEHFDFANKPKGILPFHNYGDKIATPIEEHLYEAVHYAESRKKCRVHFTVSQEHLSEFEKVIESVKSRIEEETGVNISVGFSFQKQSTDTIAVAVNNQPLRDENDKLIFRPGGHGALIENLNDISADVIFIKNIDNVIQNHLKVIATYKKALAGLLIQLQQRVFAFLKNMETGEIDDEIIEKAANFLTSELNLDLNEDFEMFTKDNKVNYLISKLNRPIRICGMVKNEGEPGGGPFWVRNDKGHLSLQIVESSQVDRNNPEQEEKLTQATHFNPVDLVCGIKDFKGQAFKLQEFIDPESGFIVKKNKNGIDLKAYELPGLWNGAMAKWNTVFVEVPLITFNPVKTVNDLLKPAHQPLQNEQG